MSFFICLNISACGSSSHSVWLSWTANKVNYYDASSAAAGLASGTEAEFSNEAVRHGLVRVLIPSL